MATAAADVVAATLNAFERNLADAGLDVSIRFDTKWYNEYIASEGVSLKSLPAKWQGRSAAILIGNSRALWPKFLSWLGAAHDPAEVAEPLDTYVQTAVGLAVSKLLSSAAMQGVGHHLFWTWEAGDRLVSMQRAAVAAGLCYHDSETQLAIHPTFGAWVAFRAVLVLDSKDALSTMPTQAPSLLPCLLSNAEKLAARSAMSAALKASDQANLCTELHGANGMKRDVRLAWAALRDCVELGREHRYSQAQLTYHYTKDQAVLLEEVRKEQQRESQASSTISGRVALAVAVSRPYYWLVTCWLYLLPTGGRYELFGQPAFWVGLLYCTFPLNLLCYLMNDSADVSVDSSNPRKGGMLLGAKANPAALRRLWHRSRKRSRSSSAQCKLV